MMDPLEHLRLIRQRARGGDPRKGNLKRVRSLLCTDPGFDRAVWRQMCEKGWLGMLVAPHAGGSGLGLRAFCDLAEELGGDLVPEPLIQAAVVAPLLPAEMLAAVLSGDRIVLPAWQESPDSLSLSGSVEYREGRLDGRKVLVPMAAGADAFLVTVPGGLALVEHGAPGLNVVLEPTQDGGNIGTLMFDRTPAAPVAGDATETLEQMILANGAYLLGMMDRALAITQGYLKTRELFDQTTGIFEAVRDRAADMDVQVSLTRSLVKNVIEAMEVETRQPARQAAVSRARLRCCDAALTVTRTCVQLHVGAPYADTTDMDLFLRKAMAMAPLYGSPSAHRARIDAAAAEAARASGDAAGATRDRASAPGDGSGASGDGASAPV